MQNLEMLQGIIDDIYAITGIKAVIYDTDMAIVCAHPLSMGGFCKEVREHKHLWKKCIQCDQYGLENCSRTGEICIYQCHMGLTEAITPIMDNETLIGYIMFGQLLSSHSKKQIQEYLDGSVLSNRQALQEELEKMECTEERIITASARLIAMCASYIHLKNILKIRKESLPVHISQFIEKNLGDRELSIQRICNEFSISRGTLYNISRSSFDMGITDYIRKLRIDRAIALLKEGRTSIFRIAEEVGISDANYLTKLIKKQTGQTPRQIKASNKK